MVSKSAAVVAVIAILAITGLVYTAMNANTSTLLQGNVGGSGVQQSPQPITNTNNPNAPPSVCPSGQSSCQVTIALALRNANDLTVPLTDGTNLATTYYKSSDGNKFFYVGASASNTAIVNYDATYNGVMYAAVAAPAGQGFYIAPLATTDKNLNPRISGFDFKDVVGNGQKTWVFKIDMTNLPSPLAGQVTSTIPLTILSYTVGSDSLNAPSDLLNVSQTAGTLSFVDWIDTIAADRAVAHYEYEIKLNTTTLSTWTNGLSSVAIENIGNVGLTSFQQTQDGTNTYLRYDPPPATQDLKGANYVVTPKNGFTAHHFTLKLATTLPTASTHLATSLTIRSLSAAQGGQQTADTVCISSGATC